MYINLMCCTLAVITICYCHCCSDGIDFVSSVDTSDSVFALDSSPGDALCITINLLNDTLFESNEDLIVELNTGDPSVMISEDANLAVVTIQDVPHHLCKD